MSNQVKQLELDFGMLTVDQQETVDRFVSSSKEQMPLKRTENIRNTQRITTIRVGFQEGIDFVNNLRM
jgi:hypothetical protein